MQTIQPKSVIKLGVFTFIMLVAIAGLLIWKSGILLRASGYEVIGEFESIGGLLKGAEVRYRGYRVGKVARIEPRPDVIRVYFLVEKGIKIPKGSRLRVIFDGLVGERYIAIAPNKGETKLIRAGDVLTGYATSGLADFVEIGTLNLEQSKLILDAVRSIIGSDEVKASLKNTLLEIGTMVTTLSSLITELRGISNTDDIKNIISSLESVSLTFKNTTDAIVKDGQLQTVVSQIGQNLLVMTTNLKEMSTQLNKTLGDEKSLNRVESIISNIETVTEELKKMAQDPDIKKALRSSLDSSSRILQSSGSVVDTLSSLDISYTAQTDYTPKTKIMSYALSTDFRLNKGFLRLGVSDQYSADQGNGLNVQIGQFITDRISSRVGFFSAYPGLGFDWMILDRFSLSTDFYDLNYVRWNLYGKYFLWDGFGFYVGGRDIFHDDSKSYGAGVFYSR